MFQIIGGPKGLEVSLTIDATNAALRATWPATAPGLKAPVASIYIPGAELAAGALMPALQRMARHVAKASEVPTELRPL